jgi:hypothetical protein
MAAAAAVRSAGRWLRGDKANDRRQLERMEKRQSAGSADSSGVLKYGCMQTRSRDRRFLILQFFLQFVLCLLRAQVPVRRNLCRLPYTNLCSFLSQLCHLTSANKCLSFSLSLSLSSLISTPCHAMCSTANLPRGHTPKRNRKEAA